MEAPQFLSRTPGINLAYHYKEGKGPLVMLCGGFKSDMTGGKAIALDLFCQNRGQAYLRLDYSGHGQSGGRFEDGSISDWLQDALFLLDQVTSQPVVLVGSSMGGWIATLITLYRPNRIKGLVTIAAACDFSEDLLWQKMTNAQRAEIAETGMLLAPSAYDEEPTPITLKLIEDGRKHLLLHQRLTFDGPVRMIHGTADPDVPVAQSLRLMQALTTKDCTLTLIKDGGHRLSEPENLARLCEAVEQVLTSLELD